MAVTITLSDDDCAMVRRLVETAMVEVDAAADPDATIQPDSVESALSLMAHYDWGRDFLARLDEAMKTQGQLYHG